MAGVILLWVWAQGTAWASDRAADLAQRALHASQEGSLEQAWKLAERALRKDPDHEPAWEVLAHSALRWQGIHPNQPLPAAWGPRSRQAWIRVSQGSDTQLAALAQLILTPSLLAEPDSPCPPEAQRRWDEAERLFAAENLILAQEAYQDAVAQCPENPRLLTFAGDAWFSAQDYGRAEEYYRAALARAPCYWAAHRFLADSLIRRGELEDAVLHLGMAVSCNPTYPTGWAMLKELMRATTDLPWRRPTLNKAWALEAAGSAGGGTASLLWRAYRQALQEAPGATALARERWAVERVLDQHPQEVALAKQAVVGDLQVWWVLSEARRLDLLEPAILSLLLDEALVPDLAYVLNNNLDHLLQTSLWLAGFDASPTAEPGQTSERPAAAAE